MPERKRFFSSIDFFPYNCLFVHNVIFSPCNIDTCIRKRRRSIKHQPWSTWCPFRSNIFTVRCGRLTCLGHHHCQPVTIVTKFLEIYVKNLRIVAQWWTSSEGHLLRLYFGVFQHSILTVRCGRLTCLGHHHCHHPNHYRHRSLYSYSEDISIVVGELALTLLHPILPSPRVPGGWKKMQFNLLTYCQHLSMHSMQKILVRKIETFKNISNWFLWVFSKMFDIKII